MGPPLQNNIKSRPFKKSFLTEISNIYESGENSITNTHVPFAQLQVLWGKNPQTNKSTNKPKIIYVTKPLTFHPFLNPGFFEANYG